MEQLKNPSINEEKLLQRIEKLEEHNQKCPIQMSSIQLYADEFEFANQSYNDLVLNIKKIETRLNEIKMDISKIKQTINRMNGYE